MRSNTKIIIPAAGYGTRVGTPVAKELLSSPIDGKPLIDFAINISNQLDIPSHLITRKEKKSLVDYFLSNCKQSQFQLITPSKEWPDTILQSKDKWCDKNILILPDTVFSPFAIIEEIISNLNTYQVVLATFNPIDKNTYGVVDISKENYFFCEKPKNQISDEIRAWGIIGFNKNIGVDLFQLLLESTLDHQWKSLPIKVKILELDYFSDLTR